MKITLAIMLCLALTMSSAFKIRQVPDQLRGVIDTTTPVINQVIPEAEGIVNEITGLVEGAVGQMGDMMTTPQVPESAGPEAGGEAAAAPAPAEEAAPAEETAPAAPTEAATVRRLQQEGNLAQDVGHLVDFAQQTLGDSMTAVNDIETQGEPILNDLVGTVETTLGAEDNTVERPPSARLQRFH